MDRSRSLRILGLPASASDDEVRVAYWSLRAHLERRVEAAAGEAERAARTTELARLDAMWAALDLTSPREAGRLRRQTVAVSLAAVGVAGLVAAFWLWGGDSAPRVLRGGDGGSSGGAGGGFVVDGAALEEPGQDGAGTPGQVVADRVRLIADAALEGAVLDVSEAGAAAPIASGPADDRPYWLEPGTYVLRVWHPDCERDWQEPLTAVAGDTHTLSPELCQDTAWLVVEANVDAAQVEVDGEAMGEPGEARLAVAPGERQVRVASPGFSDWEGIVELEGGRELRLQPQLARSSPSPSPQAPSPSPQAPAPASPPGGVAGRQVNQDGAPQREEERALAQGWHQETRQWLLARYDLDDSGELDNAEELAEISCEYWQGIESSYDASRLGLSLTRVYGFDGDGWKDGRLGVAGSIRDLAFQRMRECGLRY